MEGYRDSKAMRRGVLGESNGLPSRACVRLPRRCPEVGCAVTAEQGTAGGQGVRWDYTLLRVAPAYDPSCPLRGPRKGLRLLDKTEEEEERSGELFAAAH